MNVIEAKSIEESLKVDKNTGDNTGVGMIHLINLQSNGSEAKSTTSK